MRGDTLYPSQCLYNFALYVTNYTVINSMTEKYLSPTHEQKITVLVLT